MNARATLILENGDLRTQSADNSQAQAVAVADGRILAVGTNQDIAAFAGPETKRIDLEGRLCLPGFMDAHIHYYQWSMGRQQLNLEKARSFDEFMVLLREFAARTPVGEWIVGQGFNESDWPENRIPLRQDLDQAAPGHPVLIYRCDLHLAVANTQALQRGKVTGNSRPPSDGKLDLDEKGEPTGVLREGAVCLVRDAIPRTTLDALTEAMDFTQTAAHALGLTSIGDVRLSGVKSEAQLTMRAWQRLREQDKLRLRCWTGIPDELRPLAQELGLRSGLGDDYLRIGHVKYFFDGGMGARTAWMVDPYDDTGQTGLCVYPPEELYEELCACHDAGLAAMVHSIGDRSTRELITLYERMLTPERRAASSAPRISHHIEHAQIIRPEDIQRLARLGLPVSMMPHNMVLDINMIQQCSKASAANAYAFRPMIDAGIPVMFSSDCPVCDPAPLVNIQAAVTRQRDDGTPAGGWHPELRVSVEEAVKAYTSVPAAVYGLADSAGKLQPGFRADLIVLDKNIYEIDPLEIGRSHVVLTVFDGQVVYEG